MEITLIIVAGVVLMTVVAAAADYFTKTKVARATAAPAELTRLTAQVEALERRAADQEAKILLLEENVTFTTKLLEKGKD